MQRTSNSIGNLATALAKAQAELINPEKSLTATIRSDGPGRAEQTFTMRLCRVVSTSCAGL
jgi:hypothetical protein